MKTRISIAVEVYFPNHFITFTPHHDPLPSGERASLKNNGSHADNNTCNLMTQGGL